MTLTRRRKLLRSLAVGREVGGNGWGCFGTSCSARGEEEEDIGAIKDGEGEEEDGTR